MSNETKRDVLADAVDALADAQASGGNIGHQDANLFMAEYDAALPDDLPVIPKAVGEWIKECKHNNTTLADTLCMEMRPESVRWWMAFKDGDIANGFDRAGYLRKQDLMATAWVLGVWRVEETGEVVKL
ncbi:hypothetical protein [Lacticaseibacillus paracasei]|uniref:hypothetical protein n=1 Tax=Lacticaseibacillus paracasei TaxID=1597 RepID=UPI001898C816|nr:hypothetical protein [Lacticaseibacillus paracasei]